MPLAAFTTAMRESLLDACAIDWSGISPAIFGALFQSILDAKARRNLGAHYTSEGNILKVIKPLFLDALWAEFERIKGNRHRLFDFHKKLRTLNFLDPACGCGNFLVITYRELRLLELAVLRSAYQDGQQLLDVHQRLLVDVDQFHGIEIEEFPAQIAQVALWLMGNPLFVGHHLQTADQKVDLLLCLREAPAAGVLDFVCAWYCKAADYIASTRVKVGFVRRCIFTSHTARFAGPMKHPAKSIRLF